jgi:hypothetical protein
MHRMQASPHRAETYSIMVEPRPIGATIGLYRGLPIAERVIDLFDRRFVFVGIIGRRRDGHYDVDALKPGQFVVEPGLVYDLETPAGCQGRRREPQKGEDKPVTVQIIAVLAMCLTVALSIQLLLRIFHAG